MAELALPGTKLQLQVSRAQSLGYLWKKEIKAQRRTSEANPTGGSPDDAFKTNRLWSAAIRTTGPHLPFNRRAHCRFPPATSLEQE